MRLKGSLDKDRLSQALRSIVHRHEVLRTVLLESDGVPFQQVMDYWDLSLEVIASHGDVTSLIDDLVSRPFDLSTDLMIRAHVVIDGEEQFLVIVIHHIASDGWSTGLLLKELKDLYEGKVLEALPVQYGDYSVWQRLHLEGESLESDLSYWSSKLGGVTPFELPLDHARGPVQSTRGSGVYFHIDRSLSVSLESLSGKEGVSMFMVLLSAFNVLLYRYSGQEDITVGTPVAGRSSQELEGLIGFFINTLVLRSSVDGSERFRDFLRRTREITLEAYDHPACSF